MYERSAIVLERYLNKVFGQDNTTGIKANYQIYTTILEELEKYQTVTQDEEKVIEEFDVIAQKLQTLQKKQEMLCSDSIEQEEERNKLFNDFDQEPTSIEKKILKIEKILEENAEEQKQIREEYIELLKEFTEKQKSRNKCAKTRRIAEANYMRILNETIENIEKIDLEAIEKTKQFVSLDNEEICKRLNKIMLENGRNERIKFDANVINKAVQTRIEIAKKEAECYLNSYDKLNKLMSEVERDTIKLAKYQKVHRDTHVKLQLLEAEKDYIVSFLDYERMTAINGDKLHKQMMKEACEKYDLDITQINNLYKLVLKEISGKPTKKAYNELYNSTYLRDIEETEKNFNQEMHNIKANIGTMINTNYWRIQGIKNIYEIFNEEVEDNFGRDLSAFMPEEESPKTEFSSKNTTKFEEDDDWFISNDELKEQEKKYEEKIEEKPDNNNWFEEDDDWDEEDDDWEEESDSADDWLQKLEQVNIEKEEEPIEEPKQVEEAIDWFEENEKSLKNKISKNERKKDKHLEEDNRRILNKLFRNRDKDKVWD